MEICCICKAKPFFKPPKHLHAIIVFLHVPHSLFKKQVHSVSKKKKEETQFQSTISRKLVEKNINLTSWRGSIIHLLSYDTVWSFGDCSPNTIVKHVYKIVFAHIWVGRIVRCMNKMDCFSLHNTETNHAFLLLYFGKSACDTFWWNIWWAKLNNQLHTYHMEGEEVSLISYMYQIYAFFDKLLEIWDHRSKFSSSFFPLSCYCKAWWIAIEGVNRNLFAL